MGVPTSEVVYTYAMPRREDHEVRQGHVGHWEKKETIHNILASLGTFMFHVCNKFHMPSYCGLITLSMSIKQKAKDNFRSVATLLLLILRSLALDCNVFARIQIKHEMFS